MRKRIIKLLIYRNLIKILKKGRKHSSEDTNRFVDKMYDILSNSEPDYNSLFDKIKSKIGEEPELTGEFAYLKNREEARAKRNIIKISLSTAAAIGLMLLAFNFSSQLSVLFNGYSRNANPEIVAKISQVYDRSKALLIINDSLTIELSSDTAIFDISGNKWNAPEKENEARQEFAAQIEEPVKMNTLVIPKGSEFLVTLPDGSEVFLNSNAKFTFPSRFEGNKREVYLEGEGMFTVKKTGATFQVVSGNSVTTVLGTVFNIKSTEGADEVTLCSGSVEISNSAGSDSRILIPEQQASVSGSEINIEKVDVREVLAWTEGKYYFRNIPLEEIAEKLYDWYDIKFQFADEKIMAVPFTGMINRNSSLKTIFELFEMSYNLDFAVSDSCIVIDNRNNYVQ